MDFNDLSEAEVNELIERLKKPITIISFEKSLEIVNSLFGLVDVEDAIIDNEEVEYILRAYRGRIDANRFSVHLRFKDVHHHLIRIDINPNNRHINPITNKEIVGSHIHIYSNEYSKKDSIAIPIEDLENFPNINTLAEAYDTILEYTNIVY